MAQSNETKVPEYLIAPSERLAENLTRVDSLIGLHKLLTSTKRLNEELLSEYEVNIDDILRSATVFLHASLEDILRFIASKHIPRTNKSLLAKIPLSASEKSRATKFTLGDLSVHSGKEVDAVITESIDQWLSHQSFNNCEDIAEILKAIGIAPDSCNETFAVLEQMIARRHRIVHNADWLHDSESPRPQKLDSDAVKRWREGVEQFMQNVFGQLYLVIESRS